MKYFNFKILITLSLIINLLLSDTNNILEYKTDLELGRNNDPKLTEDISSFKLWINKRKWELLTLPGLRAWTNLIYPETTISYFETDDKIVAFTIDDGFCGLDNPGGCMINEVKDLFSKYDSKATFFTTGSHCENANHDEVLSLLSNGHELANHGMYDIPYNNFSEINFKADLDLTSNILKTYTDHLPPFYRAPHAKFSNQMNNVLEDENMVHIVCDAFAIDTSTPDPKWISKYILKRTKPGSIILIHMPERGVREWNYEAMELTLSGLKDSGYEVVTLSEMYEKYYLTNSD